MTLRDFLSNNTLLTNLYGFIDYPIFTTRFIARFGLRNMRQDLTDEQICAYAQNIVDINKDYFNHVLTQEFNPFETWSETGTNQDSGQSKSITQGNNNNLVEHSGTNTTNSETSAKLSSTAQSDSVSKSEQFVNPYNSTDPKPTNSGSGSDTASNTQASEDSGKAIQTQTLATQDKTTGDNNSTVTNTDSGSASYTKSGFRYAESREIINTYISGYDILIDYIYPVILDMTIDWSDI